MVSLCLPQGIFQTQELNRGLLNYRRFFTNWVIREAQKVKVAQSCPTLWDPLDYTYSPWNSPGQNTGVGSLFLLQGIFPTQGLNPGLPHCNQIIYQLSHQGSPRILEWVAYPFSSRSFWPRNRTRVSCITGRFLTNWAIREAFVYTQIYSRICSENKENIFYWISHEIIIKTGLKPKTKSPESKKRTENFLWSQRKKARNWKSNQNTQNLSTQKEKKKHLSSLWVKESGETEIHNI